MAVSTLDPRPPLFEFAYCPSFQERLEELASLAAPETWEFSDNSYCLSILWNYIHHTFGRLRAEKDLQGTPANSRICVAAGASCACFNTGLYTNNFEPIYGLFEANRITGKQPWVLKGFHKESHSRLECFPVLPQRAFYFSDISDLVFDYRLDIRINRDHILTDQSNLDRLPVTLRNPTVFDGAVGISRKKVAANYKLAVPQYYMGNVQLLIPLGYEPTIADVALVISKANNFYVGRTCLTLQMAYNNARLIAKPDSEWLKPS